MTWRRSAFLATLLASSLLPTEARAGGYPEDFGLAGKILSTGNKMTMTYFGWESTTYYGHTIWAMTSQDYNDNLGNNCFSTELNPVGCDTRKGVPLFTKPLGQTPFNSNTYGPTTFSLTNYFANQSEVVLVIQVNQASMNNWFFSGPPERNTDGRAHLGQFDPNGVPITPGQEPRVPGTVGYELYGFEDVYYSSSDWDFNNAIFSLSFENVPGDEPNDTPTPEPGTLLLLGTGLASIAGFGRRRWPPRSSTG